MFHGRRSHGLHSIRVRIPKRLGTLALTALLILATLLMIAPGTADLFDILTSDGATHTHGESGPTSPGPDLNASSADISLADTIPNTGQTVSFTLKVRNTGDAHAINVTVEFYDGDSSGTLIKDFFVANASSGSTTSLSGNWVTSFGAHTLTMYLDTDGNVSEDSEANNNAAITVNVMPDLTIAPSDIILNKDPVREFDTVQLTVRLRNLGGVKANNARVIVYLDKEDDSDAEILNKTVTVMGESSATVQESVTFTMGSHILYAVADPSDTIGESDDTNNKANRTISVQGVPNASLDHGAFLFSTNLAGTITITADVFGGGNATASGYKVGFYDGNPASGGTLIGSQSIPDVPVGGRQTATQAWSASAGLHRIYVRLENVDPLDATNDNILYRDFFVRARLMAQAGVDQVANPGVDVTFDGSDSYAIGGSITNYTWDFGDSSVGYGATLQHNFTNTGSTVKLYTVTLTIKDGSSNTATDTVRIYVNNATAIEPTAAAGTAPSGQTGESLDFNGSQSQVNITSFNWDFGDGSTGSGATPSHTYWDDGTYNVSLVVIDNMSAADADTIVVTVSNRLPIAQQISDIKTDVGVTVNLLVLAYDPDGYIASYLWDFGDGTTSALRSPGHSWSADGMHQVTVNVTDDDGAVVSITFSVDVTNVVPAVYFTAPSNVREGDTVRVDARGTVEPGGDITSYEWDWDSDGTVDNRTGPVVNFIYWKPGTYNISLTVSDSEGSSNSTNRTVEVSNVLPTASGRAEPMTAAEGTNVSFNASNSREPGNNITEYSWDWEQDGIYDVNTTEPIVVHVFTKVTPGYRRVTLRVTDEDNTNRTTTAWYRVTNAPPLVLESTSTGPEGENVSVTVNVEEPGDDIASYTWDWDLDYRPDAFTDVPYANHTWWKAGTYDVWVNTTDIDGTWGAGLVKVIITDVAPKPRVEDGQAVEGTPEPFTVEMTGTESNISLYSFDLDDDGIYEINSTTATTPLTFTETGEARCRVRTIDTDGTEGIALFDVFVSDVAPTVTSDALLLGEEGRPMLVTVIAYEPGMDIVSYEFDWDSDNAPDVTTTEPMASHIYTSPGLKTITVTVYDIDGSSGSAELLAIVTNAPPVADAGTPPIADEGVPLSLSAGNSSEPGDDIVLYEWDYDGDGEYDLRTASPDHMYAWDAPGTYSLRLRVMDADGTFSVDTVPVQVRDVTPTADLMVTIMPEDQPSLLDASASYDAGGIELYKWSITSVFTSFSTVTKEPVLEFTFSWKLEFQVTLTVFDGDGEDRNATVMTTIPLASIKTLPPTADWELPSNPEEAEMVPFSAWASDPFPGGANQTFQFRWQFGDGILRTGEMVHHSFNKAKSVPYEVILTVEDEDGDVTILRGNVTVRNLPPFIEPVAPIVLGQGEEGFTEITARDLTTDNLMTQLDPTAPDWVQLDGFKLIASPSRDVDAGTYLVPVHVYDSLNLSTVANVPVIVTARELEVGIGWGAFLGVLIPLLIVFLILAIIIATRWRPSGRPSDDIPSLEEEASEYEKFFKESSKPVRPVRKVEPEKVSVDVDEEPEAPEEPTPVSPTPAYMEEREEEEEKEPPIPSWMRPAEAEEAIEVEEHEVPSPPPAPPAWDAPREEPSRYKFRQQPGGRKFRGAGPPR
jgi:PKD repeat protein